MRSWCCPARVVLPLGTVLPPWHGDFDRVLERAIGVLLQTPALDEKAALYRKGVTYAYSDPRLESLSRAQKQLLRLGPRNGQIVRGKLQEIADLKLRP